MQHTSLTAITTFFVWSSLFVPLLTRATICGGFDASSHNLTYLALWGQRNFYPNSAQKTVDPSGSARASILAPRPRDLVDCSALREKRIKCGTLGLNARVSDELSTGLSTPPVYGINQRPLHLGREKV